MALDSNSINCKVRNNLKSRPLKNIYLCCRFRYSSSVEVAVSYEKDEVDIECGPFSARPGTLWRFTHSNCYEAGLLAEGMCGQIVIPIQHQL